jgi:hypothetical protein
MAMPLLFRSRLMMKLSSCKHNFVIHQHYFWFVHSKKKEKKRAAMNTSKQESRSDKQGVDLQ